MDFPGPQIRIAPMALDNVGQVQALEQACFSTPWSLDSLRRELSNPSAVFRVACLEETVAGYAGMHHILDEGYIANVAVLPAHRRRGIAAALLEHLIAYGLERELRFLTLEVRPSNLIAVQLYRRMGFEATGRRKGFYQHPAEDALIMTRTLKES